MCDYSQEALWEARLLGVPPHELEQMYDDDFQGTYHLVREAEIAWGMDKHNCTREEYLRIAAEREEIIERRSKEEDERYYEMMRESDPRESYERSRPRNRVN